MGWKILGSRKLVMGQLSQTTRKLVMVHYKKRTYGEEFEILRYLLRKKEAMAGNESQKQFLTLLREFASEKSQGERRIVNHKKRNQQLQSELELAYAEVEEAKNQKESAEQELKGYEVELARNESAIQTLEGSFGFKMNYQRMDLMLSLSRDDFIEKMLELNAQISFFKLNKNCFTPSRAGPAKAKGEDAEAFKRELQSQLAQIVSQITKEEKEYQIEQNIHRQASHCVFVRPENCDQCGVFQIEEELNNLERKASLIEGITKENMEMQENSFTPQKDTYEVSTLALDLSTIIVSLTGSKQTSELENKCASLGDELQKRSVCPRCHKDNTAALSQILQAGDEN
ncbi:hypothetical protein H5410_009535 [Solanum commersonii]|uniref:Uncharacterized protein n=1 Tax=Solanum commersonii TaxID=4109 RepID=A0A9J6AI58_SOLCO|nr:hypothetical protein H5410_009535 [Solanum commersonii]